MDRTAHPAVRVEEDAGVVVDVADKAHNLGKAARERKHPADSINIARPADTHSRREDLVRRAHSGQHAHPSIPTLRFTAPRWTTAIARPRTAMATSRRMDAMAVAHVPVSAASNSCSSILNRCR